jgi:hypothetical protein
MSFANESPPQLDVSDDGFLSLMADDGETKDDVKIPEGEVGEKIEKLFTVEEKDTSQSFLRSWSLIRVQLTNLLRRHCSYRHGRAGCHRSQGGSPRLGASLINCYSDDSVASGGPLSWLAYVEESLFLTMGSYAFRIVAL